MRALNLLRESPHYRRDAFNNGLQALGYQLCDDIQEPLPGDVLLIWNRYGRFDTLAQRFEAVGAQVIVVENGYLGKNWKGGNWYSITRGHVWGVVQDRATPGSRWDRIGVECQPWVDRPDGINLILGQRGIGEVGYASPPEWAEQIQLNFGGKIRKHPGKSNVGPSLQSDLNKASRVFTWGSSAAFQALLSGVPVHYDCVHWIGRMAATKINLLSADNCLDLHRQLMFQRLAWYMWDLKEIISGDALEFILN